MKTACTPSQVMRDGLEVNQQGHAGRHEHASSKSPEIFQEGFFEAPASAAIAEQTPNTRIPNEALICFITGMDFVITLRFDNEVRKRRWQECSVLNESGSVLFIKCDHKGLFFCSRLRGCVCFRRQCANK